MGEATERIQKFLFFQEFLSSRLCGIGVLDFQRNWSTIRLMSNEQFDDMAVLSTFAGLRDEGLLNAADLEALREQLKTSWGRKVFDALRNNTAPKPEDQKLLERFSTAFAA